VSVPIVAIVGRPNVGKSMLFNRIVGKRISIVEDTPGVTRDRIYADAEWSGHRFTVIDTGGLEISSADTIIKATKKHAEIAIESAEVIIFTVDGKQGLTSADEEVAEILRKAGKPVVLAVNKIDNQKQQSDIYDFYRLALGEPIPVSAAHGLNIGELLDEVVKNFKLSQEIIYDDEYIKTAVIGRPNVGKSSLINRILGEERVIVSDIPGTTRDAVDTLFKHDGSTYVFIDTAGMRRRGKVEEALEYYSVLRGLSAIERSDVVLMVLDATESVTEQDKKIAGYAHEKGRAVVLVVNKWDLIEKNENTINQFRDRVRSSLIFMQYAPIIFISAKTGQRVNRVIELIKYVADQHAMRIQTSMLNQFLQDAVSMVEPPSDRGRRLKLFYMTQTGVKPPRFSIFVNDPELVHFSYKRYIENQLRSSFGLEGTPIHLSFKQK
jgi:GTP-binding protein